MTIKSFFANSVQEAIDHARLELGPDAMLLNSKKADSDLRSLGLYEVVFGLVQEATEKPENRVRSARTAPVAFGSKTLPAGDAAVSLPSEIGKELADLRLQIETVKRSMVRQQRSYPQTEANPHPGASDLCGRLMASGFSEDLAQELAEAAELRAFASRQPGTHPMRDFEMAPSELLKVALQTELNQRVQTSSDLGLPGEGIRIVVLAGPAGAGKTTALIKLAIRHGLRSKLPMHLLSLDTLRVGGWEQMGAYARIAGLSFDAVHNWNLLEDFITQQEHKKLIFIDSPGVGLADSREMSALNACLARHGQVDLHLVCPATLRPGVASRLRDNFRPLQPSKLLLTHLDEAESVGSVLEVAIRLGLPLSYLSDGQNIPEDIQEASKANLVAELTQRRDLAASAA